LPQGVNTLGAERNTLSEGVSALTTGSKTISQRE